VSLNSLTKLCQHLSVSFTKIGGGDELDDQRQNLKNATFVSLHRCHYHSTILALPTQLHPPRRLQCPHLETTKPPRLLLYCSFQRYHRVRDSIHYFQSGTHAIFIMGTWHLGIRTQQDIGATSVSLNPSHKKSGKDGI